MSGSRLPVELLGLIFASVCSKRTLSSICLSSHQFYSEAVKILYESVEVPFERRPLESWWNTVASNARLALLVKSLKIPCTNWELGDGELIDFDRVQWGLRALKNLRELDLEMPDMEEDEEDEIAVVLYGILARCSFRLRRCTLRDIHINYVSSLLANQPEIRDFTYTPPASCYDDPELHDVPNFTSIMPNLTAVMPPLTAVMPSLTTIKP